ncbi:hypothetical protein BD779DRAFT_1583729 [Infundibulicybe gibba]|nr:hypothetical protein BD779DRAFT_1583729 [Infundibulicybe gibba]
MESHPAHTSLPLDAHQKAMDVLNWASTNELLPPNHSTPAPFTQEECQRLTALLQSISTPYLPERVEAAWQPYHR